MTAMVGRVPATDCAHVRCCRVFEREGVEVVVDETSLPLVRDAEVDFMNELIGSAFRVVNNPAAGSGCGCGTSFEYRPKS